MKNIKAEIVVFIIVLMISFGSCKKIISVNTDKPRIDEAISNAKTADSLSHAYNDTLAIVEDTVLVRLNNANCIKYDELYHRNDSLFSVHYDLFSAELYKYGKKMRGYIPPAKISDNMRYSDGMTTKELIADTIVMSTYYSDMQQLQVAHQQNHSGIYN